MEFTFDKKLFFYLSACFVFFTIAGTLSHELGHYLTAKILGYKASIHYASTEIKDGLINPHHSFLVAMGGLLATLLIGTFGFVNVLLQKKTFIAADRLSPKQWLQVLLSLFWLRQLFNFVFYILFIIQGKKVSSDENDLARSLHLPEFTISFSLALIAVFILIPLLKFIPLKQRITFVLAGLAGSFSGFCLWFLLLGPEILP